MPPDAAWSSASTRRPRIARPLCCPATALLAARSETMGRGQAERLMPMLEECWRRAASRWRDLTRIGVGTGPGNFTGIRISVAAARGLALASASRRSASPLFEAMPRRRHGPTVACATAGKPMPPCRRRAACSDLGRRRPAAPRLRRRLRRRRRGCALPHPPTRREHRREHRPRRRRGDARQPRPAPLYLRPADAAPPRDAPPVILP